MHSLHIMQNIFYSFGPEIAPIEIRSDKKVLRRKQNSAITQKLSMQLN